ncbi:MAG: hypothetical protein ACRCTQ_02950, partial [Brevinemataceae bacterium]
KWKDGIFFARLWQQLSSSDKTLTIEARKACGYPIGKLHSNELSKKRVFVVTEKALRGEIDISYRPDCPTCNVKKIPHVLKEEHFEAVKIIILFANFLGATIKKGTISSTKRTIEEQADIIINDYIKKGNKNSYAPTQEKYYNTLNKALKTSESLIVSEEKAKLTVVKYIKSKKSEFYHIEDNFTGSHIAFDIAPNSIGSSNISYMQTAFSIFRPKLINKESINYQEKGDNAFHFVFR